MKKKSKQAIVVVSAAVRALRERRGKSLSAFGAELEIDRSTLHRYEVGDMLPQIKTTRRFLGLALERADTQELVPKFAAIIAQETGLSTTGVIVAALIAAECPSDAPSRAELAAIGKRAIDLIRHSG